MEQSSISWLLSILNTYFKLLVSIYNTQITYEVEIIKINEVDEFNRCKNGKVNEVDR